MDLAFLFARDAEGRELFAPWQPWSSRAYVIPDDAVAARLRAVLSRHFAWSLQFTALFVPVSFFLGFSWWALLGLFAALLAAFAWQAHRLADGLVAIRNDAPYSQRLHDEASHTQRSRLRFGLVASTIGLLVGGLLLDRDAGLAPILVVVACAFGALWSAGLLWHQSRRD